MNILLIFADQMHKYALGKVNDEVYTPNLDKLSEEGVLFNNTYSNNPICGPFRGNLLTGQYSSYNQVIHNGDPLPDNIPSLADAFNEADYETSFVGKWHLGGNGNGPILENIRGGFKHFIGYQCYNGFIDNVCFYDEKNQEHKYDQHRTDVTTKIAIERIKKLNASNKPFIQAVGYQAPHYPEQPSPRFEEIYKDKTFSFTPDYKEVDPYTPTFSPRSPRPFDDCPDYQRYGNDMQEYLRLYYAMVSQIDAGIGEIMDCLEELKIKDNTVVIFTSDHGDMQGSHGMKNKCLPYEKSCGIPLIISCPQGRKNIESDILLSSIDLYPTLLDLASLPQKEHLQGKSIANYLLGEKQVVSEPVFAEFLCGKNTWKMVRKGDYKLTVDWETKEAIHLFNLKEDPYELNNLIKENKYISMVKKLRKMVLDL